MTEIDQVISRLNEAEEHFWELQSAMREAAERLKARETGWISVKDRLPEAEGSTLICTEKGAVCTAKFYPKAGKWNGYAGKNARYWMPLPEGPKEET